MSVDVRYAITPRSTQNAKAAGTSLDSAKMQTYANTRQVHQRRRRARRSVQCMLYLLAIATGRGMETFLATILNTSQIKKYE